MRLLAISLISLFTVNAASAQDFGVILLDARDEHTSCVTRTSSPLVNTSCGSAMGLSLGRTVRLLVLNRRFMTDYALELVHLEETAQRPLGGAVSPVSLATGTSVSVQPSPAIQRKSALDFLGLLADVTSASEAVAEIDRENQVVEFEFRRIGTDVRVFNQKYTSVVGGESVPLCDAAHTEETGIWLEACLRGELNTVANWNGPGPPRDEKDFRDLVRRVDSLFEIAKNFGLELAAADVIAEARRIETTIAAYDIDLQTFRANLNAAQDATWIVEQLVGSRGEPLLSLQIRKELRIRLDTAGAISGKSFLDEAETNEQIDRYFTLLRDGNSIPQVWRQKLNDRILELTRTDGGSKSIKTALDEVRNRVDSVLPTLVSEITERQERLAASVNEIYQGSEVPVTESDSALTPISSSGIVSYRILRTSEFEPYTFSKSSVAHVSPASVEVSRGAFAVSGRNAERPKRTLWQILRLTR